MLLWKALLSLTGIWSSDGVFWRGIHPLDWWPLTGVFGLEDGSAFWKINDNLLGRLELAVRESILKTWDDEDRRRQVGSLYGYRAMHWPGHFHRLGGPGIIHSPWWLSGSRNTGAIVPRKWRDPCTLEQLHRNLAWCKHDSQRAALIKRHNFYSSCL